MLFCKQWLGALGKLNTQLNYACAAYARRTREETAEQIETVQTTIMSAEIKGKSVTDHQQDTDLKRVQFYNWFRLHQILYQL